MGKKYVCEEWTGDVVKELHLLGKTQTDLANYLGINKNYVCEILNGRRKNKCAEEKFSKAIEQMKEDYLYGKNSD